MFKAKEFDAKRVNLGPNVPVGVGYYSQRVMYDGAALCVQLPPMLVSRGMYQRKGRFFINVLVPHDSVTFRFVNSLNTAVQGTLPIVRTTQDNTGTYKHLRLRVTLPPLVEGTEGCQCAKVGRFIRAVGRVDYVDRRGEWDIHLERIE